MVTKYTKIPRPRISMMSSALTMSGLVGRGPLVRLGSTPRPLHDIKAQDESLVGSAIPSSLAAHGVSFRAKLWAIFLLIRLMARNR